jgi:hypothetical protein
VDSVDGSLPATCSRVSGSLFALGTTTVTCSSTDAASNTGQNSFTVTVVDTTQPVLAVPGPITVEATGPSGAAATFAASGVDSVDGSLPATCNPVSGAVFALGTTTVTCTTTDAAKNSAQKSFTVTVIDTTGPALSATANQVLSATGPTGAPANFTLPTATDLVDGSRPVTCDQASGGVFAIGTTTVHCSASDTRGNVGTSAFDVRVTSPSQHLTDLLNRVPPTRHLAELRAAISRAITVSNGSRPSTVCGLLNGIAGMIRYAAGHDLSRSQAASLLADLQRIQAEFGCRR